MHPVYIGEVGRYIIIGIIVSYVIIIIRNWNCFARTYWPALSVYILEDLRIVIVNTISMYDCL